jgi:protease-4
MKRVKQIVPSCLVVVLLLVLVQGCAVVFAPELYPHKAKLREEVIREAKGIFVFDKVLVLDISGVMADGTGLLFFKAENPVDYIKESLKKAERDGRIKAVVLRVDSPGGSVTTCDTIYHELMQFKEKTGKKIIAAILDVGASGGYYVSLAADKIYVQPTSITGSIGVLATFPSIERLVNVLGIRNRVIKSGEKKDIGSMWREFTPEEQQILENLINELFNRFVNLVTERRPQVAKESLATLSDGRIFTAQQALDMKLVDGIAYLEDVIDAAIKEAGLSDAYVVAYRRPSEYKENIYSRLNAPAPSQQYNLLNIDASGRGLPGDYAHFYYLWLP